MNGRAHLAPKTRAQVVDAVRGVAVIAMMVWHSADAWLAPPHRGGELFAWTVLIGGLAAPLFLLLAGVAAGLVEPPAHDRATTGAMLRRAGQITVLGYALKAFALGIDRGGAIEQPTVWLHALGLAASYLGLGELSALPERHRRRARAPLILGGIAASVVAVALTADDRSRELMTRLDVLQGIGAALAVLAVALPLTARSRWPIGSLVIAGVLVALATPPVAALDVELAPEGLRHVVDYLARLRPYPAPTHARFPLLPWLAYTLVGAAMGRWMRGRALPAPFALPRPLRPVIVAVLSAAMAIVWFEANPLPQWLLAPGELARNAVRLVFNLAVALFFGASIAATMAEGPAPARFLALLGRHSLLLYAVHLEIVYGLPTVPLVRSLSIGAWLAALSLLVVVMTGLVAVLERYPMRRATRAERIVERAQA